MSVLKYASILARPRIRQIWSVSKAILKNEISYYPRYLIDFEKRCASYFGTEHALTFCNGTSAIEAAMFAVGVGPGDEVIVPSCTFHASIDPIINAGAKPVFVDVDENSFTLCPSDLIKKITSNTKAIVVVHIFGIPADLESIKQIIENKNIYLIEDASHAHGGEFDGKKLGNVSDIGIFSFQGNKAVAAGEGGVALTNSEELFLKMSLYGHFDRHSSQFDKINAEEFKYIGFGHKYRMAPVSALIAEGDLHYLDRVNVSMRKKAALFDQAFSDIDGIEFAKFHDKRIRGGFCNGYPIYITKHGVTALQAVEALRSKGISATLYPFPPHHKFDSYNKLSLRQFFNKNVINGVELPESSPELPVTEKLAGQLLLLPRRYLVTMSKSKLNIVKDTLSAL
jgi:dTDP-4-amino-4,6-dideoxygalactose transaminase